MAAKPSVAFLLSLAGGSYQLLSLWLLAFQPSIFTTRAQIGGPSVISYVNIDITLFFTGLVLVWSSSHFRNDPEQRVTWASIIVAMATVNIAGLTAQSVYSNDFGWGPLVLLVGPVLAFAGGIIGLAGIRVHRSPLDEFPVPACAFLFSKRMAC